MSQAGNSPGLENAPRIRMAVAADVELLARLINAAFVVEQPFIEGERINTAGVREYMKKGKFLVAEEASELAGCVYVELRGERGYLGLLGVDPAAGNGLGPQVDGRSGELFSRGRMQGDRSANHQSSHASSGIL